MGDRSDRTTLRKTGRRAPMAALVALTAVILGVPFPASADTGPPSKPTGLTVSSDGLIQWDPPSSEDAASLTGYHLAAGDGTGPGVAVDLPPDATSYQVVIVPEERYDISLVAMNSSGASAPAWWGICLCQAPDAPTDFQFGTLPNGHYGASWVPPADWGGPKHHYVVTLDANSTYPTTLWVVSGDRDYVDLSNQLPRKHSVQVVAANDLYNAAPVVLDVDVPLPPRLAGPITLIKVEDAEHQVNPPADWVVTFAAPDDGGAIENVRFAIDGVSAASYQTTPTTALVTYPFIWDELPRFGPHVLTVWGENRRGGGPVTTLTIMRGPGPVPFQHVSVTPTGVVSWSDPLQASGVHEPMTSQIINVDGSGIALVSPDARTFQLTSFSTGATSRHVIQIIALNEDPATNPGSQSPSPLFPFTLDGVQPDSVVVSRPLADHSLLVRWHQPHPDSLDGYVVTATAISNDTGRPYVAATISRPGTATAATLTGLPTDQPVSIHVEARSAAGSYGADGSGHAWNAVPTSMRLYQTHIVGSRGTKQHATIWLRRGDKTLGAWLPHARISLYARAGAQWRFVAHAVTDSHGTAVVDLPNERSAHYRIAFPAQRIAGARYAGSSGTLSLTLR